MAEVTRIYNAWDELFQPVAGVGGVDWRIFPRQVPRHQLLSGEITASLIRTEFIMNPEIPANESARPPRLGTATTLYSCTVQCRLTNILIFAGSS